MSVALKRTNCTNIKSITIILASLIITILSTCERIDYERVIKIETGSVTSYSYNWAQVTGEFIDLGESNIIQYGHCWSTNQNPSKKLSNKTALVPKAKRGSFNSDLVDLSPDTKYYFWAYAINSRGDTVYGSDNFFTTTQNNAPIAAFAASKTNISVGEAVVFTDASTNNPTSWSWSFGDGGTSNVRNPLHTYTVAGTYKVTLTATNDFGSDSEIKPDYITVTTAGAAPVAAFTANPTAITAGESVQFTDQSTNSPTSWSWDFGDENTSTERNPIHTYSNAGTYTVSLMATNSYGSNLALIIDYITVTGSSSLTGIFTDDRDGHKYKWVKIGNQVWMAENLAYLPGVSPSSVYSFMDGFYYVYEYEGTSVSAAKATDNYATYGVLYNWPAAMNGAASSIENPSGVQGICPSGWHLPSDVEWIELTDYLGGENIAGGKLKEAGYEHWLSPNTEATNSSGFTGLPGGFSYAEADTGVFSDMGFGGYWWSTGDEDLDAYLWGLDYSESAIIAYADFKSSGNSVRCVKD